MYNAMVGNILVVLWAYKTMSKRLIKQTPFILVYRKEAILPLEFVVHSLHIALATNMKDD